MYSLPKSYKSMPEWSFLWIKHFKNRLFSSKTILRKRSRLIFSTGAGAWQEPEPDRSRSRSCFKILYINFWVFPAKGRLWFWLRRLSLGLCSEKSDKNLWFFHYIGQRIGVRQEPELEPHHFFMFEPRLVQKYDAALVLAPVPTPILWPS
jgi:hypothetical protein